MDKPFQTIKTSSSLRCAELCHEHPVCGGSMLSGDACVMYEDAARVCPGDYVAVHEDIQSKYKIFKAGAGDTRLDMRNVCQQQDMQMIAINTELEYTRIVQLVMESGMYEYAIVSLL